MEYNLIWSTGDQQKIVEVVDCINTGTCDTLPYDVCIIGGMCSGKTTLWRKAAPLYAAMLDRGEFETDEYSTIYRFDKSLNVYTTNNNNVPLSSNDVLVRVFADENEILSCRTHDRNIVKNAVANACDLLGLDWCYSNPDKLEKQLTDSREPAAVIHLKW